VRLNEHQLPKAKPLTQVGKTIAQTLAKQKASNKLTIMVDDLLAQPVSKDLLVAKASQLSIALVELVGVSRTEEEGGDSEVVVAAFNAKPVAGKAVGSVALRDGSIAVYVVNNIVNAVESAEIDLQVAAVERMLANTHGQQDIVAVEAQLKAAANIQIN
jgi:hypothetical protein